jgi:hypothetical protein
MAIPTGATSVRLKIAPQRGQMLVLAEIMPPHAGHLVILVMTLSRFSHRPLSPRPLPVRNISAKDQEQTSRFAKAGPERKLQRRDHPIGYFLMSRSFTIPGGTPGGRGCSRSGR